MLVFASTTAMSKTQRYSIYDIIKQENQLIFTFEKL